MFICLSRSMRNYYTNKYSHKHITIILCTIVLLIIIHKIDFGYESESSVRESLIFDEGRVLQREHKKIDWNNYDLMYSDGNRRSKYGEHGAPAKLGRKANIKLANRIMIETGCNGLLSDKISLNRSIPDYRSEECKVQRYYGDVPSASVIICFRDDYLSILLRTVYSVINRTPVELLEEIILIDDGSIDDTFIKKLIEYVSKLSPLVKLIIPENTIGETICHVEAAQSATGAVLVFLDSATEVGYNWLPPLLDPILANFKSVTVPITDHIHPQDFHFAKESIIGRGSFDWNFEFHLIPPFKETEKNPDSNYKTPIIIGKSFAVSARYYWDIGGQQFWGCDPMEISFKTWLCGGEILMVPCSRVANIHRLQKIIETQTYNIIYRNQKHFSELWLDDYKKYLYEKDPKRWDHIPVERSKSSEIAHRKQCKPFQYFLDEVAPDLTEFAPFEQQSVYASGILRSVPIPNRCLSDLGYKKGRPVGISKCTEILEDEDAFNQHWELTRLHQIKSRKSSCLARMSPKAMSPIILAKCFMNSATQEWKYNLTTQQLQNQGIFGGCLEYDPREEKIIINECSLNPFMKWEWEFLNSTAFLHPKSMNDGEDVTDDIIDENMVETEKKKELVGEKTKKKKPKKEKKEKKEKLNEEEKEKMENNAMENLEDEEN